MKVGDLVKWTDYTAFDEKTGQHIEGGIPHIGFVLKHPKNARVLVLYNGDAVEWTTWQCEVVSEVVDESR